MHNTDAVSDGGVAAHGDVIVSDKQGCVGHVFGDELHNCACPSFGIASTQLQVTAGGPSWRSRFTAALISARWVSAWGKLPS